MRLLERLKDTVSTPEEQSASATIAPEQAYAILDNDRRRRVIEYLAEYDVGQEVDVRDIADHLATGEDDRTACYVSLIQSHLIQFDPEGRDYVSIVDYDERAKTVRVRPELHTVLDAHDAFVSELN